MSAGPAEPGSPSIIATRPSPWLRLLDGLAGLTAAGMVLIGLLLLLSTLIAPALLSAAGLGVADGPGWPRVGAHLLVGVAGELVVRYRRNWSSAMRVVADLSVLFAASVVIAWAWWL